ncbi:MAG: MoaD/ThiS family protein [Pseudomonadales bacterium]
MAIEVLYFAALREQLDCAGERIDWQAGESIARLAARLAQVHGEAGTALLDASVRAACNQQLVESDAILEDGDEVAFFPPLTGG